MGSVMLGEGRGGERRGGAGRGGAKRRQMPFITLSPKLLKLQDGEDHYFSTKAP